MRRGRIAGRRQASRGRCRGRERAGLRPRQRLVRTRSVCVWPRTSIWHGRAFGSRTRWCVSARSTCSKACPPDRLWPFVSPPSFRSRPRRAPRATSLLAGGSDDAASLLPIAARFDRATQRNSSPRSASTPIGPRRGRALGTFFAQARLVADAESEYRAALRLSPQYVPAAVNLADLYRQLGRDADGERVLRAALAASPRDAGIHHALGLTLVRLKRLDEAFEELHQAAELAPEQAQYAYAYAIALHSTSRTGDAIAVLKASLLHHPRDRNTLVALTTLSRDGGDLAAALDYSERLLRLSPDDQNLIRFTQELRRMPTSGQ